ncbi:L,D-transpeptidase family protein [Gallaecimonas mangrovi]|uniref:L,D-transpeptidase family protein n=1 Tax=Gallaecimonas mangrovi TaxID=2291597 RepID=UPI000E2057D8|nr:L,D-transpeptidase family protein [Gallaecimonas mangrovi]
MKIILVLLLVSSFNAFAAQQLIVITTDAWQSTQGQLRTFEKKQHHWQPGPVQTAVSLGRSGLAWGLGIYPKTAKTPQKVEGDGKTPAGIFQLGTSFGYAKALNTALPYLATTASSYCMDVPQSPYYNQLINSDKVGEKAVEGSTEPLRLDLKTAGDMRYQEAIVVKHNPANIAKAGSCIFLHIWKAPGVTTAGCSAMPKPAMDALLAWLTPESEPLLVVMPKAIYEKMAIKWKFPQ